MFNFDEAKVRREQKNGLELIPKVEGMVDEICKRGYSNIFYMGIGGTVLYADQFIHIAKQLKSTVEIHLQNAADFIHEGNPFLNEQSVVVIESISGDTKEMVEALEKVKEIGAVIIGYVEKKDSILDKMCDNSINTTGAAYYFWYTVTLRFLKNAGHFSAYDNFFAQLVTMEENIIGIYADADEKAKVYAEQYGAENLTYVTGSGNLEGWAVCEAMCIMEEMQWMKTRPVSAADFFHGTLEVIEKDVPIIIMKGEDCTRPEAERVERFAKTVSAKVIVFDTKDYRLNGVDEKFRGILSPMVMRTVFQRVNTYLEYYRRHPLGIRRYYRRLEY